MPFGVAIYEPSAIKVVSNDDVANSSMGKDLYAIEKTCRLKCSQPDCIVEDFSPKVIQSEKLVCGGFELYATNEPDVITEFKEKTSFVDYITMLLSCIGFWFGFSPLFFLRDVDIISIIMSTKDGTKKVLNRKRKSVSKPKAPAYDNQWTPHKSTRETSDRNDAMLNERRPSNVHYFEYNFKPLPHVINRF